MTGRAAYLGLTMGGPLEIRVRCRVAGQTTRIDFLRGSVGKRQYFGFVAAARHVIGARSMTALATLMRYVGFLVERRLPVRRFFPFVVEVLVTGLACVGTHILGAVGGSRVGLAAGGVARMKVTCRN